MANIYWDTMLFIYLIEEHPEFGPRVEALLEKIETRGDALHTSCYTLGELLVGPRKKGQAELEARIREVFQSGEITLIPFTERTADHYARIRADHKVTPADAIHLACAAEAGVDLFLTNDQNVARAEVSGIKFVAGLDAAVL